MLSHAADGKTADKQFAKELKENCYDFQKNARNGTAKSKQT
jgi:hypothetical protein